jgi:DNA-binding Lrp family transcriptional regulator
MMKSLQESLPDLDELDLMLVRELEQNARVSFLALASKLGTSQQTVRRRFNRLVDQGIITIATIPAYAALGYEHLLVLAINSPPGMVMSLARQLVSVNEIKYLWITAGRYDILAVALYRSPEDYLKSFPEDLGSTPGNVRVETMSSFKVIKSSWSYLTDNYVPALASHSRVKVSELDLSVIRGLEKSPRVPVKELAHDIGASLSSVRSSLRKLTSQGVIRVMGVPDAAAFGYTVRGMTLIQVHPSLLMTLTDKLKVYPCIQQMLLTIGEYNCLIWTSFQGSDEMSDFLVHDLGNMPGVVHYESLVSLKVQKRSFSLMSENQAAGTVLDETRGPRK